MRTRRSPVSSIRLTLRISASFIPCSLRASLQQVRR